MAWKMSQKIWLIFLRAVESLKICTLMGSFCTKHIKFLLKKYRRFMSHDNEEWRKVWRKTNSWWILLQAKASLKICTLMCYFCRKYIMSEPKKTRGVMWQDTEERCKIWTMSCALKNDIRNLTNFDPTLESLKIYTLMDSFWPKYKMFELKKYRGVMYHYNEDRYKHFKKNNL